MNDRKKIFPYHCAISSKYCVCIIVALYQLITIDALSQTLPEIPDSAYVNDEIIIWFQDNELNRYYLGCSGNVETLPLNTDFIASPQIVAILSEMNVLEMRKMIPAANPCTDTISISTSGSILRMPSYWNAIVVKFTAPQNIPLLAYSLVYYYPNNILWAQPNYYYEDDGAISNDNEINSCVPLFINGPNDTYWINGSQSALEHSQVGEAYVDSAWFKTTGDSSIRIGMLDQGMDYRHPDLGSGCGLNFRVRGAWNYIAPVAGASTWLPFNFVSVSHGTLAMGLIGAISNNTIGVAGVCGGDSLALSGASLYALTGYTSETISNAIYEASANPGNPLPTIGLSGQLWYCDILCIPQGISEILMDDPRGFGLKDEIMRSIISFRYQNGRTTFCSYGDGRHEHMLSNVDKTVSRSPQDVDKEWVINVSCTERATIRNTEDFGEYLDLLAATGCYSTSIDLSGSSYVYSTLSNSSGAAPIAAGVGGLLLSYHRALKRYNSRGDSIPSILYPDDVEWLLKISAQRDSINDRWRNGWGVIRANRTLEKLEYPFILRHDSITISSEDLIAYEIDTLKIASPGWTRDRQYQPLSGDPGNYHVKRYHVQSTHPIDKIRLGLVGTEIENVWGYGANDLTGCANPLKLKGLHFRLPLYPVGWCNVLGDTTYTQDSVTLETYVYTAWEILPNGTLASDSVWIPRPPNNIYFTYTVLARATQATSIKDVLESNTKSEIDIYPNPSVSSNINISLKDRNYCKICIYDIMGREISILYSMNDGLVNGSHVIQVSNMRKGVYYAVAYYTNHVEVKQFVINR